MESTWGSFVAVMSSTRENRGPDLWEGLSQWNEKARDGIIQSKVTVRICRSIESDARRGPKVSGFGTPARLHDAVRHRFTVARTDFTLRPFTKDMFKL